ncbi:hypothetical protein ABZU76_08525 [Amycolatopsis sp. NPDC005232]|uniref:hypothetical protein n=1 Tax=Amycolatopsis sp. NPDC005232 TaxID=3157027 RepID=UPI0033B62463
MPARWSCRTGVCQTCGTPDLSGSVGYAPLPLESSAAGQALLCCSTPAHRPSINKCVGVGTRAAGDVDKALEWDLDDAREIRSVG